MGKSLKNIRAIVYCIPVIVRFAKEAVKLAKEYDGAIVSLNKATKSKND